MILSITLCLLLLAMTLTLIRAFAGPSVYDRILAVNAFGTLTVLFIAALGYQTGRPEFLDISLLYAMFNFLGTIAVLKYIRFRDLVADDTPPPDLLREDKP